MDPPGGRFSRPTGTLWPSPSGSPATSKIGRANKTGGTSELHESSPCVGPLASRVEFYEILAHAGDNPARHSPRVSATSSRITADIRRTFFPISGPRIYKNQTQSPYPLPERRRCRPFCTATRLFPERTVNPWSRARRAPHAVYTHPKADCVSTSSLYVGNLRCSGHSDAATGCVVLSPQHVG